MVDQDKSQPRLQSSRASDDKPITSPLSAPATSAPKVTPAPIEKGKTCSKTVLDVLEEGEGFSTLVEVLKITGMAEALDKLGAPLALFAPHDTVSISLTCAVEGIFWQYLVIDNVYCLIMQPEFVLFIGIGSLGALNT